MARTANPRLHAHWRERIRCQEASGLTIEQYCSQEGLTRSKFHAWKRRFRLADATKPSAMLPAPPTFLPVTIRALPRNPEPTPAIEADLPNGVRLRISTADLHLACRLLRAVVRASTRSGGCP